MKRNRRGTAFVPKELLRRALPAVIPLIATSLTACNTAATVAYMAFDANAEADAAADSLGDSTVQDASPPSDVVDGGAPVDTPPDPGWIALAVMAFDAEAGHSG